jgi:hypothetical protein
LRHIALALPDKQPQVHALDYEGRPWFGDSDGTLAVVDSNQVRKVGVAEGLDIGAIDALHVGPDTIVGSENRENDISA